MKKTQKNDLGVLLESRNRSAVFSFLLKTPPWSRLMHGMLSHQLLLTDLLPEIASTERDRQAVALLLDDDHNALYQGLLHLNSAAKENALLLVLGDRLAFIRHVICAYASASGRGWGFTIPTSSHFHQDSAEVDMDSTAPCMMVTRSPAWAVMGPAPCNVLLRLNDYRVWRNMLL